MLSQDNPPQGRGAGCFQPLPQHSQEGLSPSTGVTLPRCLDMLHPIQLFASPAQGIKGSSWHGQEPRGGVGSLSLVHGVIDNEG